MAKLGTTRIAYIRQTMAVEMGSVSDWRHHKKVIKPELHSSQQ